MRVSVRPSEVKKLLSAMAGLALVVATGRAEQGLVNHWKFDGTYEDSVGTNHAWAVHTDVKGPPTWETGRFGKAVTLGDPVLIP